MAFRIRAKEQFSDTIMTPQHTSKVNICLAKAAEGKGDGLAQYA